MKTTTLNKIRRFAPCRSSWEKLLSSLNKTKADDEDLSFRHIYDTLGTLDTLWCLRTLEDLSYCVEIARYSAAAAVAAAVDADYADYAADYAVDAAYAAVNAAIYTEAAAGYAADAADAARKEALITIGDHLMKLLENEK